MPSIDTRPSMTIDEIAEQLYEACPTSKPSWDQLGEVTKGVWRERAIAKQAGVPITATAAQQQQDGSVQQGSLF